MRIGVLLILPLEAKVGLQMSIQVLFQRKCPTAIVMFAYKGLHQMGQLVSVQRVFPIELFIAMTALESSNAIA